MTRRAFLIIAALCWPASLAWGHDPRPIYVEVTQIPHGWRLHARIPPILREDELPEITLVTSECLEEYSGIGRSPVSQRIYRCPDRPLPAGVSIRYPNGNPSLSTIVRLQTGGDKFQTFSASPSERFIGFPAVQSTFDVLRSFGALGTAHVLSGWDHLLFVATLMWIAAGTYRVTLALTGFTLGHSLTLALTALQIVSVSISAVEACIALSVVALAAEALRPRRDTLAWRYPVLASLGFGLLHGCGFASALREIGLPVNQTLSALLAFNLGVEAGQLTFVVVCVSLVWLWRRALRAVADPCSDASQRVEALLRRACLYGTGTVTAYWFWQRLPPMS